MPTIQEAEAEGLQVQKSATDWVEGQPEHFNEIWITEYMRLRVWLTLEHSEKHGYHAVRTVRESNNGDKAPRH